MNIKLFPLLALIGVMTANIACSDEENTHGNNTNIVYDSISVVYDNISDFYKTYDHFKQKKSTKRGVCYSFKYPDIEFEQLETNISWYYNWGNNSSSAVIPYAQYYGINFVPMIWNNSYNTGQIKKMLEAFPDNEYILTYNEPNLTDQANMTPKEAAKNWPNIVAFAKENNLKIVSPAMNFGTLDNYNSPTKWLDEFFACPGVNIEDIDAIALHCYLPDASGLKGFVDMFEKYGKPIWLTEYSSSPGDGFNSYETQKGFCAATLNYLEANPKIERYSWFMARATGSWATISFYSSNDPYNLNELGMIYAYGSSQDKDSFAKTTDIIEAEQFSSCSAVDSVKSGQGLAKSVSYALTKEKNGILDIVMTNGTWTEYQVDIAESGDYILYLHLCCDLKSTFCIDIDGNASVKGRIEEKGSWTNAGFPISLKAGKHTIKVRLEKGKASVNWLTIQ